MILVQRLGHKLIVWKTCTKARKLISGLCSPLGLELGFTLGIELGAVLGNKHCSELGTKLSFDLGSALGA